MFARIASLAFIASFSASLVACTAQTPDGEPSAPVDSAMRAHQEKPLPAEVVVGDKTAPHESPAISGKPSTASNLHESGAKFSPAYPAGARLEGRTLRSYANEYVDWYTAIAKSKHPALGGDCDTQQNDLYTFFLAGSMTEGKFNHVCRIDATERNIFVPILTAVARACPEVDGCGTPHTAEQLDSAVGDALLGAQVKVEVDGVALDADSIGLVETTSLAMNAPADGEEQIVSCTGPIGKNDCGIEEGERPGAATMYAAMLRPLSRGAHVVHVVGKLPKTGEVNFAVVDVTWNLRVD